MKTYSFNGLAGCVKQRKNQKLGTVVSIYHGVQAGMKTEDSENPWQVVCEEHGMLVGVPTLKLAKQTMTDPTQWCECCRKRAEILEGLKNAPADGKGVYMHARYKN